MFAGPALLGWLGFQTLQLSKEREQLGAQAATLVKATQALAQQGNPNVQAMVAELQRRGITIKPDGLP